VTSELEGQVIDRKSLRVVTGRAADFQALANDCVCFANSAGGTLLIGIEDEETHPPPDQRVDPALLDRIRKRIGELTVNVQVLPELARDDNGGDYILLQIPRSMGVASTSDGRYFLRVGDTCRPVTGDDVLRLADERPSVPWETMTSLGAKVSEVDPAQVGRLTARLRASDRVKDSVKEKSDGELLEHYRLATSDVMTNLGILLVGRPANRARLGTAPIVQAIRYDDRGVKVGKFVWDDYELSPFELIDAIWASVPDFRESYEFPDGMFRTAVPAFDEAVVRELLVNALVHRPYTQRGDIFLNLHPDRMEVVNPGRLPLGVTPKNILHASRRRNDGLARMFHDLKLMEREGSGFDLMYEKLLGSGRTAPVVTEGVDSVHVTIPRRLVHPGTIRLLSDTDQRFQLTRRERIVLALLAQSEGLKASEFVDRLELNDTENIRYWLGRLTDLGLVRQVGRTRATRYFVEPGVLKAAGLDAVTTLTRVESYRVQALILEDLGRYPDSAISEIHRRIGSEIPLRLVRRALASLLDDKRILPLGDRRWRKYRPAPPIDRER
jgi:ATP-dependent DNA helicase RecG